MCIHACVYISLIFFIDLVNSSAYLEDILIARTRLFGLCIYSGVRLPTSQTTTCGGFQQHEGAATLRFWRTEVQHQPHLARCQQGCVPFWNLRLIGGVGRVQFCTHRERSSSVVISGLCVEERFRALWLWPESQRACHGGPSTLQQIMLVFHVFLSTPSTSRWLHRKKWLLGLMRIWLRWKALDGISSSRRSLLRSCSLRSLKCIHQYSIYSIGIY